MAEKAVIKSIVKNVQNSTYCDGTGELEGNKWQSIQKNPSVSLNH